MIIKSIAMTFVFLLVVGLGFMGAGVASAQTATFPAGCTSALGYSITTGLACNGTATATIGPLPGCSTALGFSITTGAPCSGGPIAISFLAGCTSVFGYSTISGAPCNGTTVVSLPTGTPLPPVLPTTGAGGGALKNVILLMTSGMIAALGVSRFVKRTEFN